MARTSPARADTAPATAFDGVPTSCSKVDLVTRMQTSAHATDCGELAVDASPEDVDNALRCAARATRESQPFSLFWRAPGEHGHFLEGIVGRAGDGGRLEVFKIGFDSSQHGFDIQGSTAAWSRCTLEIQAACDGGPRQCLNCQQSLKFCACLPRGKRPAGAADGDAVEVRCGSYDEITHAPRGS
ncbi:MAG TPA: hypothetical protein VJV78_17975 [Polyangiales bacterium]|nr:hypothetical protein [Polyangiales bacterium]